MAPRMMRSPRLGLSLGSDFVGTSFMAPLAGRPAGGGKSVGVPGACTRSRGDGPLSWLQYRFTGSRDNWVIPANDGG
jgi:hypothetical protein